jgi:hypothetical protein
LVFFGAMVLVLAAIHSKAVPQFLDNVLGFAWSKDFFAFLSRNTDGFLVLFVLAFYDGVIRPDPVRRHLERRQDTLEHTISEMVASSDDRALIRFALCRAMDEAPAIDGLIDNVLSTKGPFSSGSVSIRLGPSAQRGVLQYNYTLTYTSRHDSFMLAFAEGPIVSEALFAAFDGLTEVILTPRGGCHEPDEALLERVVVRATYENLEGKNDTSRLAFRGADETEVSDRLKAERLESLLLEGEPGFRLYECPVPGAAGSRRAVQVEIHMTVGLDEHYVSWVSDRPIFLDRLTFDVSAFPQREAYEFALHPFLGSSRNPELMGSRFDGIRSKPYVLDVGNWVVRGQGACLIWRHRPNSRPVIEADDSPSPAPGRRRPSGRAASGRQARDARREK